MKGLWFWYFFKNVISSRSRNSPIFTIVAPTNSYRMTQNLWAPSLPAIFQFHTPQKVRSSSLQTWLKTLTTAVKCITWFGYFSRFRTMRPKIFQLKNMLIMPQWHDPPTVAKLEKSSRTENEVDTHSRTQHTTNFPFIHFNIKINSWKKVFDIWKSRVLDFSVSHSVKISVSKWST